jgi:hypothetical protein
MPFRWSMLTSVTGQKPCGILAVLGSYGPSMAKRLVELHRDWAVIELPANGSRRVFERRRVDAGNVTLPWIEWGRRPGDV